MPSIELDNVSVMFPVYSTGSRSLKNALVAATTGGRIGSEAKHVVIQALDQVSLQLRDGDRVALIGHNGAGKTTLLRVLAGIYEPRVGSIRIEGRVTPMFDINLGIDPESTGYENIILRGLYLGLTRAEILARRDSVAEFTELGPFLDIPVRTYSAGMQARLAFAMATCIEPEILLLDEGIGAGDASFLEKANERLDQFIKKAGILVLASHSVDLVRRLCNRALLMEHGRLLWGGGIEEGLALYHERHVAALSTAAETLPSSPTAAPVAS
jgi:ABC-type polysaccharide/polyol phosphate transport system ATPase subunit